MKVSDYVQVNRLAIFKKGCVYQGGVHFFTREGEEKDSYTACGEIISLVQCWYSCPWFE